MSTPILPPNPSLISILLNVRTRAGPNFVFHYPAIPNPECPTSSTWDVTDARLPQGETISPDNSADDDRSSDNSLSNEFDSGRRRRRKNRYNDEQHSRDSGNGEDRAALRNHHTRPSSSRIRKREHIRSGPDGNDEDVGHSSGSRNGSRENYHRRYNGESEPEWEHLLGFPTSSLEKLLSPQRYFHKKKLEIGLDELVFLGYPIFAKEGGTWRRRRKKKREPKRKSDNGSQKASIERVHEDHVYAGGEASSKHENSTEVDGTKGESQVNDSDLQGSDASETKSTSTGDGDNEMTMFTIVFVLRPPLLEYKVRVMDMYDNIVKKFAKALKYEQVRSNYVWKESRKILEMKDKAKENLISIFSLWPDIISASPLARSIAVIFDSISSSKIAHVNLGEVDTSLQIPQEVSTWFLLTPLEPQVPGLWLTTATLIDEDTDTNLSPHAALLLLEDANTLIKEVEGDAKQLSGPLANYIRISGPTKSLKKISLATSTSLVDIQVLARHLIYWRRARAIPPLNPRDTYLVSPNADLRKLRAAIQDYANRFPTLPSMPEMLHKLSVAPRQYITLIPSKDHKAAYMEILAFLMRGGWVMQLRTFAWIRVTTDVKLAVVRQEKAKSELKDEQSATTGDKKGSRPTTPGLSAALGMSTDAVEALTRLDTYPKEPKSERPKGSRSSSNSQTYSRASVLSPLTSTATQRSSGNEEDIQDEVKGDKGNKNESNQDSARDDTDRSSKTHVKDDVDDSSLATSLILDPSKPSRLQSLWMDHIRESIADPELREVWPAWVRYFDGRHALDEIAAREGLKRKRVVALLSVLKEMGVLLTIRHW